MNWDQGQVGSSNIPTTPKYKGMVKVLPTTALPTSPRQNVPPRPSTTTVNSTALPGPRPINIYPEYQRQQVQDTMTISRDQSNTNNAVPRLPPPPEPLRVNNTQRMERLDNQIRLNLAKSIPDLRYVGNDVPPAAPKPQESIGIRSNNVYDRRSLNLNGHNVLDIRNMPITKNQLPLMLPFPVNQTNRPNLQAGELPSFSTTPMQQTIKPPLTAKQGLPPPQPITPTMRQPKSEMSSLHDQMAQLKLELAAMKDPMKEHEEWLKSQAEQVRELEELLQSNMVNNKTEEKGRPSSNLFTAPSVSPIIPKTPIKPLPPKSPTAVEVVPAREFRPPITSPKPTQQKSSFTKNVHRTDHANVVPKPEVIEERRNPAQEVNISKYNQSEQSTTPIVKSVKETSQSTDTSSKKVKRLSQLFEGNTNKEEIHVSQNSTNKNVKSRNGTIKKLSPALLQTIQASEDAKSSSKLPSTNIPNSNGLHSITISKQESLPVMPPTTISFHTHQPSTLSSVPPSFSKPTVLASISSPTSKPIPPPPSSPKPILPKPTVIPNQSALSSKPSVLSNLPPPSSKSPVVPTVPQSTWKPSVFSSVSPPITKPSLVSSEPPSTPKPSVVSSEPSPIPKPSMVSSEPPSTPKPSVVSSEFPSTTKPSAPPLTSVPSDVIQFSHPNDEPQFLYSSQFPSTSATTTANHTEHRYENIPSEFESLPPSSTDESESYTPDQFNESNSSYSHEYYDELEPQHEKTSYLTSVSQLAPKSSPFTVNTISNAHNPDAEYNNSYLNAPSVHEVTFMTNTPSALDPSPSTISSKHSSPQLSPHLQRPTARPPPPPTVSSENPPNMQNVSSQPVIVKELQIPTAPSPPSFRNCSSISSAEPSPTSALKSSRPTSLDMMEHGNSARSSLSSLPGTPSSETASKADLMEQIRQFKQSGKLKRASSDMDESSGTPTRVRKNSMHDALQTRFQAFCGNGSESSDDEDDEVYDDWDD